MGKPNHPLLAQTGQLLFHIIIINSTYSTNITISSKVYCFKMQLP